MKKIKKEHFRLLAVGLLTINAGEMANLMMNANINVEIVDFMKGLGLPLVVAGASMIAKNKIQIQ